VPSALKSRFVPLDDYFALDREGSAVRWEWRNGEVYCMGGAQPEHNLCCLNIGAELRARLRGSGCLTFPSDQRVVGYLLVDSTAIAVLHYRKSGEVWTPRLFERPDETLDLPELGIALPLVEIYLDTGLSAGRDAAACPGVAQRPADCGTIPVPRDSRSR
jgi:hypothetical protein